MGYDIIYSSQAQGFLEEGFSGLYPIAAPHLDNPPLFPLYLAAALKTFGRGLFTLHWAMLPIALGIVWQSVVLIRQHVAERYHTRALLLLFAEPLFLSQFTWVSAHSAVLFCYLLGLNQITKGKNTLKFLALLGLSATHFIGFLLFISLFITEITLQTTQWRKNGFFRLQNLWPYLLVSLAVISWSFYSEFALNKAPYAFPDVFYRDKLAGWRLLLKNEGEWYLQLFMYGRAILTGLVLLYLILWALGYARPKLPERTLILAWVIPTAVLEAGTVLYQTPVRGVYLLIPVVLAIPLLFSIFSYSRFLRAELRLLFFVLTFGLLVSSHAMPYYGNLKNTLYYRHYFPAAEAMQQYLKQKALPPQKIGAPLPYRIQNAQYAKSQTNFAPLPDSTNTYRLQSPAWQAVGYGFRTPGCPADTVEAVFGENWVKIELIRCKN